VSIELSALHLWPRVFFLLIVFPLSSLVFRSYSPIGTVSSVACPRTLISLICLANSLACPHTHLDGELADVVICELKVAWCRTWRTRVDDECKFCKTKEVGWYGWAQRMCLRIAILNLLQASVGLHLPLDHRHGQPGQGRCWGEDK